MILIFRIFFITISCKTSDEFSVPPFHIKLASDLDEYITAVSVIDQILKWDNDLFGVISFPDAVIVIVDGNKPDFLHRKDTVEILSGFNIVSSKTGKVFDDDAVDFVIIDFRHHADKARSFKIRPAESIVNKFFCAGNFRVMGEIFFDQLSLVMDTIALGFVSILPREAEVNGGSIR